MPGQSQGGTDTVFPGPQCLGRCHIARTPSLPILLLQPHTTLTRGLTPCCGRVLLNGWVIWRGFQTAGKAHIQPQISQVMPRLCFTLCAYLTHTQFLALPTQGEINSFLPARLPVTAREPWPLPGDLLINTISMPHSLSPERCQWASWSLPWGQEHLCTPHPQCRALGVFTFLVGEPLALCS